MNEQMIPDGNDFPRAPETATAGDSLVPIHEKTADSVALNNHERKPIIQSTKEFFENTFGSLKGKDVGQMVEQFSGEMTLVAEGLSEDQARLSRIIDRVSSEQTVFEQSIRDDMHDLTVSIAETNARVDALAARVEKAEKAATDKKIKKTQGFTALLRQATWLVGILAGAWIVTTVINLFK